MKENSMTTKVEVYACTRKEYDAYQEFKRQNPGKSRICGHVYEAATYAKALNKLPRGAHVYEVCFYDRNMLTESHLEVLPWNIQW